MDGVRLPDVLEERGHPRPEVHESDAREDHRLRRRPLHPGDPVDQKGVEHCEHEGVARDDPDRATSKAHAEDYCERRAEARRRRDADGERRRQRVPEDRLHDRARKRERGADDERHEDPWEPDVADYLLVLARNVEVRREMEFEPPQHHGVDGGFQLF